MAAIKKPNWRLIIRWAGTILSILLLIHLVITLGQEQFLNSIQQLSGKNILLVILLIYASRLATFARWHVLLQVEDMYVNWKDSLRLTFAGLFAANFFPSTIGGDVVRLAGAMRIGIRGPLAAASLIVDRLIGMFGMATMLPFALGPLSTLIQSQASLSKPFTNALTVSPVFIRLWHKLRTSIFKIVEALRFWYRHPLILAYALVFTFVHMTATFLILQILVADMGESISFIRVAGLWSLIYFITLVPISINGLGLQEITIATILPMFGGISHATSLSAALVLRGLWIVGSLPGAFFVAGIISGKPNHFNIRQT